MFALPEPLEISQLETGSALLAILLVKLVSTILRSAPAASTEWDISRLQPSLNLVSSAA